MAQGKCIFLACHMHDQGIVLRTAFGGKNAAYGRFIQCVGAKTVHRFGGKAYQLAFA